jgi:hypothetical protein
MRGTTEWAKGRWVFTIGKEVEKKKSSTEKPKSIDELMREFQRKAQVAST